jgi:hypothetical protein
MTMEIDVKERRFFLVSIKHSEYPKDLKRLVLWGNTGKTPDDGERSYAGYTSNPDLAEVYSLEDLQKSGYGPIVKVDAPVPMRLDLVKKWKKQFDSVPVDVTQYRQYYEFTK